MNKKVYIIGPVTGLPRDEVRDNFGLAEQELKNIGMIPVNPINLVPETSDWNKAMRICIANLVQCDMVLILPNHLHSKGAMIELQIARGLAMPELSIINKKSKMK
ncbi:MAG: DUF4406 domain-containing protein [Bacteroidales bacterium]|jgi:hypothetical protein|nr:DUF4406 domain-containing protein [Bacteroidales bacterium]HOI31200.1 DUF4406 domain-containing protein [Bacteroidales bacterium]